MSEVQAAARAQQQVEELCAAALRALAGETDLHYRGRRLHRGRRALPLFAPHLHPRLDEDDFGSFRGAADGLALRLKLSDEALHKASCPHAPVARLLFDMLEQFRVESLADDAMPGVRRNLRHRFEAWARGFQAAGLADSERGILIFTVAQTARSRVTGEAPPEEAEDLMEATRAGIASATGQHLVGLRRHRTDQAAYAVHARALAEAVAGMLASADDEAGAGTGSGEADDEERAAFSLVMDMDAQVSDGIATVTVGRSLVLDASKEGYRIFTTAHDREHRAATLVRPALLREQREQLDRRIAAQGVHVARLARDLQALLAEPTRDGWDSAQEEGLIDGRRLAQLVAVPTERRLFRTERREPVADCVLAFLIDCSGSMREHIESVAMVVDVTARALELAGVASEVLGFTTGAWNGGRAMRDWIAAGRPAQPGRLNEAAHLVFKDADTPWRRARPGIAALLKADLFKEGIDGEAVDWACARLAQRPERHKLLVVVSDGCPMDGATNLANDPQYLDQHLREVVARHEQAGEVQVFGLGVGLDLSPYYSRAQAVDLSVSVGQAVFRDLLELLAARRWR
ncbi:cobaltochelatase CobT-related protein [Ideonella sp. A 288]|uniref:cobaltochelatase CobT-related protein n=1 Tax=Ideonella sp. A 288 TaxID=1962181 RepID=UPI000B4BB52A|nr:cobalt chelatase [Ideonella sp. A 288]